MIWPNSTSVHEYYKKGYIFFSSREPDSARTLGEFKCEWRDEVHTRWIIHFRGSSVSLRKDLSTLRIDQFHGCFYCTISRQGQMCSRCLRMVDDKNLQQDEDDGLMGVDAEDDDRSLIELISSQKSDHGYRPPPAKVNTSSISITYLSYFNWLLFQAYHLIPSVLMDIGFEILNSSMSIAVINCGACASFFSTYINRRFRVLSWDIFCKN